MPNELTQRGIAALKSNDKATAHQLLTQATQLDPNDEQAWLWLSAAVTTDAERRHCLEQALRINPHNAAVQRGLAALPPVPAPAPAPAVVQPVPTITQPPAPPPMVQQARPVAPPAPVATGPQGHWSKPIGIIMLIMLACVSIPFIGRFQAWANQGRPKQAYVANDMDAYIMCKNFVTKQLKAPATADFESMSGSTITKLDGDRWSVRSHVDAENSFGANIRTDFDCTVRHTGNAQWTLEELTTVP